MLSNRKEDRLINLGTISIENRIIISDPCYSYGTYRQLALTSVQNGKWFASVIRDELTKQIIALIIYAETWDEPEFDHFNEYAGDVYVQSGRISIFNEKDYGTRRAYFEATRRNAPIPSYEQQLEEFQKGILEVTRNDIRAGIMNNGVVCSHIPECMNYPVHLITDGRNVFGVKVTFVSTKDDYY